MDRGITTTPLKLSRLILDAGTQIRATIHTDTVDRYAEALSRGESLPSPVVVSDGISYWLVDGFHRVHAYLKLERKQIAVDLRDGSLEEALALACSVNREHDTAGLARTNADKRRAVETLLMLDTWKSKSTRLIAEHCGVSNGFVHALKEQLFTMNSSPPETVESKDGKQRPAKRKAKKAKAQESTQATEPITKEESTPESISAEVAEQETLVLTGEVQYTNGHDLRPYYTIPQWEALSKQVRQQSLQAAPKGSFNRTNDNVEWAWWTWNPITGCLHDCPYCYARDIANRFYTGYGFTPVFHPARLHIPAYAAVPTEGEENIGAKNVFVCSMADLFGKWVPKDWIQAVIQACTDAPQWNFLFLTKFPMRLAEFTFPDNAWVGTSVDTQARVAAAEKAFRKVSAKVKWLSCEPLCEPLTFSSLSMFQWVVIGGASKSEQTPEYRPARRWVSDLEAQADRAGCQVYQKTNLHGERRLEYPGNPVTEKSCPFDYAVLATSAQHARL